MCVRVCVCVWVYVHMHADPVSRTHTPFACCAQAHTLTYTPLCPLLCVDEIRWFLLGEAAVHPSAAPPCTRPTANAKVMTHLTVTRPLHLCLLPHPPYALWTCPQKYCPHTHYTSPAQSHIRLYFPARVNYTRINVGLTNFYFM